jgi:CRISPR-associated endonuclease Csn1
MEKGKEVILGIDLGTNSVGWAALSCAPDKENDSELLDAGVRIYESALSGLEKDGVGESKCANRRVKRGQRRIIERKARRLAKLAGLLQKAGLLPSEYNIHDPQIRNALFEMLDKEQKVSPYKLRARALDEKLMPFELGRALYHLGQRRGFWSNRREGIEETEKSDNVSTKNKERKFDDDKKDKDDERKKVKAGINSLAKEMGDSTLGEYFASIEGKKRIRERYTSREMYQREFSAICNKQKEFYPDLLTEGFYKSIYKAIFFQRPLKTPKRFVGFCELEKGERRYPWAYLEAQRFRYLQKVNDLTIIDPNTFTQNPLNDKQRTDLIEALEKKEWLEFKDIRKKLSLPEDTIFNLERGGEKRIPGNKTAAKLRRIFGDDRWDSMADKEKNKVVEDWRSIVKDKTLMRRGINHWKLDAESARRFGRFSLESGYCRFSKMALDKLLPELNNKVQLQTAINKQYEKQISSAADLLPPVLETFPSLTNPAVIRMLTQLRLVVNAYIKKYGKPDTIRIELARAAKRTAKERLEYSQMTRKRQKEREGARILLREQRNIYEPSNDDLTKALLYKECFPDCPYTGRPINFNSLFDTNSEFHVEHIIPYDRSLDDSFTNKTLCYNETNAIKGNRTPYEAFHDSPEWNNIIDRVKKFRGDKSIVKAKLRRFLATPEEVQKMLDNFVNRQLNDTAYAAKLSKKYLGKLYGGVDDKGYDEPKKLRVQATNGEATAKLCYAWGLNNILGEDNRKNRGDHRQHAVDAIAIALTTPNFIKMLSDNARSAQNINRLLSARFRQPWNGFHAQVRQQIDKMIVSHMASHRVRGALHDETFYSVKLNENGKKEVYTRKSIKGLTEPEKKRITDINVLNIIGGNDQGAKRVKIIPKNKNVIKIGKPPHERFVLPGSVHHMEIFEEHKKNRIIWTANPPVTLFEANRRKNKGEPIINKAGENNGKYLFSLSCGDTIELDNVKTGKPEFYVVKSTPQSKQIEIFPINVAMKKKEYHKINTKGGLAPKLNGPKGLKDRHCRKVIITPLGEVRYAND